VVLFDGLDDVMVLHNIVKTSNLQTRLGRSLTLTIFDLPTEVLGEIFA
jgi:hypothetical protein